MKGLDSDIYPPHLETPVTLAVISGCLKIYNQKNRLIPEIF